MASVSAPTYMYRVRWVGDEVVAEIALDRFKSGTQPVVGGKYAASWGGKKQTFECLVEEVFEIRTPTPTPPHPPSPSAVSRKRQRIVSPTPAISGVEPEEDEDEPASQTSPNSDSPEPSDLQLILKQLRTISEAQSKQDKRLEDIEKCVGHLSKKCQATNKFSVRLSREMQALVPQIALISSNCTSTKHSVKNLYSTVARRKRVAAAAAAAAADTVADTNTEAHLAQTVEERNVPPPLVAGHVPQFEHSTPLEPMELHSSTTPGPTPIPPPLSSYFPTIA